MAGHWVKKDSEAQREKCPLIIIVSEVVISFPFQTTQGNRLSCRDLEGRGGSEEAVPGPSVFPSPFSKTSLNIRKFTVHVLLKPCLKNFEHYFTSV